MEMSVTELAEALPSLLKALPTQSLDQLVHEEAVGALKSYYAEWVAEIEKLCGGTYHFNSEDLSLIDRAGT